MRNKKIVALIVLSIAAFLSLVYGITSAPSARKGSPAAGDAISGGAGHSGERFIPPLRSAKETNFTFWGRNPFVPKKMPVKAVSTLKLSGIVWDEKAPKALINGSIMEAGDRVDANTVIVEIRENYVILNDGVSDFELRLGQ